MNKQLDERHRIKMELKEERRNIRRRQEQRRANKDNPMRTLIRIGIWSAVLLLCVMTYRIVDGMIQDYHDTQRWTKENGPSVADIPVSLLYANEKDKRLKLEYIDIQHKVWDEKKTTFKPNVTQSDIDLLTERYKGMPEPKDFATPNYEMIQELWQVERAYRDIIQGNVIPVSTSTSEIQNFVSKYKDVIIKYRLRDEYHQYAKDMYDRMRQLNHDVANIETTLDGIYRNYTLGQNSVVVNKNTLPSMVSDYKQPSYPLHFKWKVLDERIIPIFNRSSDILIKHQQQLNAYEMYQKDEERRKAFESFKSRYLNREQEIKDMLVELNDFKGQHVNDVMNWSAKHNIELKIVHEPVNDNENKVIRQEPKRSEYKYILSGATLEVVVGEKIEPVTTEQPTTERPTTERPTTEQPTTEQPTTEQPTTEQPTDE